MKNTSRKYVEKFSEVGRPESGLAVIGLKYGRDQKWAVFKVDLGTVTHIQLLKSRSIFLKWGKVHF